MTAFYLQVEALNLSDFIFDTDDLSTRRGGSLMLLNAIEEVTRKLNKDFAGKVMVIQEAASVGLYHLEPPDGTKCEDIKKLVRDAAKNVAPDATFGVACMEVSGDDADAFLRDRQTLLAQIRWDQMQSLSLKLPPWNDNVAEEPCDRDKVRPSAKPDWKRGSDKRVSEAVLKKHEFGKAEKQKFYKKETEGVEIGSPGKMFSLPDDTSFVNDLEDLTKDSEDSKQGNLNFKMAIIHIDGNGFGAQFDAVAAAEGSGGTPWERYGATSKKLKDYRRAMLASLLAKMKDAPSWRNGKHYRIETLLWGGDEITWVVPALKGWETLQLFYEKAKDWKIDEAGKPVTHAAGLVFCNHKAPIQRMITLAENLCHAAKAKSRDKDLIAFQVMESFDFIGGDLEGFRKNLIPGLENELFLYPDDMGGVIKAFDQLRNTISRKSVYRAAQAAHEEGCHGMASYQAVEAEAQDGGDGANLMDKLKKCLSPCEPVFWYHVRELWDYIPQKTPQTDKEAQESPAKKGRLQ